MLGYKIWYLHGETKEMIEYGSSSVLYGSDMTEETVTKPNNKSMVQMVNDVFQENLSRIGENVERVKMPN